MKKKLLLASALFSVWGATAQAQTPVVTDKKWDGAVERLFKERTNPLMGTKANSATTLKGLVVTCTDAETVAENIRLAGYEATAISDNIVSASVPVSYIPQMAEMEEVSYINGARQFQPTMNNSRKITGVDRIHQGEGLETPFTGKGVIVGVIDQGFEYKHLAFLDKDKESRVRAIWNHYNRQSPTTRIPTGSDNIRDSHGHATHVTNIAAGSKVNGNNYYGIATGAEIIMIPSRFDESDVLEEAKYIHDFAKKEGKPYVINMSFGSQIGAHDGTDPYCQGMNAISQPGGILVAAMGNEGGMKLHAHHKFTTENEKVYLIVKPQDGVYVSCLDLWGQQTDGQQHLKVRPLVFNKGTKKKDFKNEAFWNSCLHQSGSIEPYNKKEHYYYQVNVGTMQNGKTSEYFGVEIEGNPGEEFHAWVNPGWGEIYNTTGRDFVRGDNDYCVGEGAASIPYAIAVASYNGNDGNFTSIDGKTYNYGGRKGTISDFSSRGPSLGPEEKPLIAAPGHVIASAVSSYAGFDDKAIEIVSKIQNSGKKYYYEVMSGTSMATPTVTGIIALWLEANPLLTYEQIKQIFKETAIQDNYTGKKDEFGYGKIDAYAGLKKALELAENLGINDQMNSETPISLMKEQGQLRILFNNDESFADIALYNAGGMKVKQLRLDQIRRGNETVLSTAGLPAGAYVVRIQTTASSVAKKMLVK